MNFKTLIKRPGAYAKVACLKAINVMRSQIYKGNEVICDICSWNGKQFFNGKCPNCNSLPRTRLIPFSLRYFDMIEEGLSILHIAPNLNEYNYVLNNFSDNFESARLILGIFYYVSYSSHSFSFLKSSAQSDLFIDIIECSGV